MLKKAIRFHCSWQPNFLTTDMIESLVGSYVGHAMIFHKKLRRMLAMKCRNLSMNHRIVISWILRQPIIQLAILIQMKQENNQEKIEQRSSVYWRYTQQNTQHAKALQSVLCKRKAMIHVSEEMKTKASDLDRLTEQIREKKTLGSTTFEEKAKILTLTTESWSIVKAASYLQAQRRFWHWRNLSFICDKPWQVTVWCHWRHSKNTNGTC